MPDPLQADASIRFETPAVSATEVALKKQSTREAVIWAWSQGAVIRCILLSRPTNNPIRRLAVRLKLPVSPIFPAVGKDGKVCDQDSHIMIIGELAGHKRSQNHRPGPGSSELLSPQPARSPTDRTKMRLNMGSCQMAKDWPIAVGVCSG